MSFIPNSFSLPNAWVDWYWHLLTSEEKDVLVYIARRIYGFHGKTCDGISLSQFENGIVTREGKRLDYGCGMHRSHVLRALEALVRFRLVVVVREAIKAPPRARRPAVYALQLDCSQVNIEGLEQRFETKKDRGRARTQGAEMAKAARKMAASEQPDLLSCGTTDVPHREVSSHDTNNRQVVPLTKEVVSNSRETLESSNPYPFSLDLFSADDDTWNTWSNPNDDFNDSDSLS